MEDFEELELQPLVAKVVSELQGHLGDMAYDRISSLAKILIAQRVASKNSDEFSNRLKDLREFPGPLVDRIDDHVVALHPRYNKKTLRIKGTQEESLQEKRRREKREKKRKDGRAGGTGEEEATIGGDPPPRPSETKRRPRIEENEGEDKDEYNNAKRRRREQQKDTQKQKPASKKTDDKPMLYKVYDGHITGVKDFGAFVNLDGVKQCRDGLVHVSALVEDLGAQKPSDLFSKGQQVKVKVIKIEGRRIALSMKDVDQQTGFDLAMKAKSA
ncbi:uncharacterized protein BCR38DRAFT_104917 [Pseudomassariella vexata]|uniref:S1 motif domain-containing protein n=1 Tax=Pseudomassariella vexata TaxID=1141098 RepID=A0A1Y2EHS9_9PEZI|nr:uncharacterized protein BCR38DRAFT_104917 [Pseudomassariella vexata]ORY70335.1 hypothetical protein BCR38DRAFT_104917 [Pseudomassariella vexata]